MAISCAIVSYKGVSTKADSSSEPYETQKRKGEKGKGGGMKLEEEEDGE